MSSTGADAGAAAAAAAAAAGGTPPWFSTFPDEVKGYVVNRGLDKGTASEAFLNAQAAHRNAEKAIGAPSDRVFIKPADASDTAGWDSFYSKLGRPAKAEEYAFTPANDEQKALADFLRPELHRLGTPKAAAEDLWGKLTAYDAKATQDRQTAEQSAIAVEDTELRKSWGTNYPVNKVIAQRAAAAVDGLTPEQFEAAVGKKGLLWAYQHYLKIGQKIGEDKFVSGTSMPAGGAFTREQALSRRTELLQDKDWARRYTDGGRKERDEMTSLLKVIAGEDGRGGYA